MSEAMILEFIRFLRVAISLGMVAKGETELDEQALIAHLESNSEKIKSRIEGDD